jgi:hypothetical protein
MRLSFLLFNCKDPISQADNRKGEEFFALYAFFWFMELCNISAKAEFRKNTGRRTIDGYITGRFMASKKRLR